MEDGFNLQQATIGILGLGLMGGSLAMGLKGQCARLIGFDADPTTLEHALLRNIVDQIGSLHAGARVDVLILATPVPAILSVLQQLPTLIAYPCILLDIGSTKREITAAMAALPKNFDPMGTHPICGKEKLGLENAEPTLFRQASFVMTPLERTSLKAKSAAQQIIAALGARPLEISAAEHDRILATTSHLPFLLASALASSTPAAFAPFLGTGFRSTSRLAGTPSRMMLGVLQSNREDILGSLRQFSHSLYEMEIALQNEEYGELETLLDASRSSYLALTGSS